MPRLLKNIQSKYIYIKKVINTFCYKEITRLITKKGSVFIVLSRMYNLNSYLYFVLLKKTHVYIYTLISCLLCFYETRPVNRENRVRISFTEVFVPQM